MSQITPVPGPSQADFDALNGKIGNVGSTDLQTQVNGKANKIYEFSINDVPAGSYKQVDYPDGYSQSNAICVGFYMVASGSHYYNQYGNVTLTSTKVSVTNSFQYNQQFVVLLTKK